MLEINTCKANYGADGNCFVDHKDEHMKFTGINIVLRPGLVKARVSGFDWVAGLVRSIFFF